MAASTSFLLTDKSQEAFLAYYREIIFLCNDYRTNQRNKFEEIDKQYQREKNLTDKHEQSKLQNKAGNSKAIQDITVPIVMPQVEASVVYQTSVFLTGVPIFGVVSNPQYIDEALQMETILDSNSVRGGWTKELILFFRNGAKYNFSPIEVPWERETVAKITTDINFSSEEGRPNETVWTGNNIKCWDPYNTFVDPRVEPSEVYKEGEFAGHTEFLSRIQLKQFISQLSDKIVQNVTKAFEAPLTGNPAHTTEDTSERYYVPDINPDTDVDGNYENGMNWLSWAGLVKSGGNSGKKIDYKNAYEKTTLYCKILPSEFDLKVPAANTPQIWKLIIINHSVIIHAERQTNAHGWIPVLIGQPNEDGLRSQTKSLAQNAQPFQEVTTAFMGSILASRRRAISDRTLYDPSRVLAAHINSENPSAKIPVRPAAYGKKISDSVYQFPYNEDQGAFSMQQIRELISMANLLNGQNPTKQGQFVKGNKTKSEFQETLGNANGRDQLVSILTEVQVFTPMKTIFKLNILQYQGADTLYNRTKEKAVTIDPVALRRAVLEFKISDGLVPSDKIINADVLKVALQVIGSSPQLAGGYDVAGLFSYLMKTQGAKINDFEKSREQIAYEQALNSWNAMMQLAIEKGIDPKTLNLGEQPKPQDYGYNPGGANQQQGEIIEGESQRVTAQ